MNVIDFLRSNAFWIPYVALAVALYALAAKFLEKPRLKVELHDNVSDLEGEKRYVVTVVKVTNPSIPWFMRWLTCRQAVHRCWGTLTFRDSGGRQLLQTKGRWRFWPEMIDRGVIDADISMSGRFVDIVSGARGMLLSVAWKYEGQSECYASSEKSQDPLPSGRFRVKVQIESAEVPAESREFTLHNDSTSLESFCIEA